MLTVIVTYTLRPRLPMSFDGLDCDRFELPLIILNA